MTNEELRKMAEDVSKPGNYYVMPNTLITLARAVLSLLSQLEAAQEAHVKALQANEALHSRIEALEAQVEFWKEDAAIARAEGGEPGTY